MSRFVETAITGKIIAGAVGLIVVAGAATGVGIVHHQHQVNASRINTELSQIRQSKSTMDSTKNQNERVQKLRKLENDYKSYLKNNKKHDKQVVLNYQNAIQEGKNYFVRHTQAIIKSNQVKDVNKVNKKDLQKKLGTLNQEMSFVNAHRHVIYSNKNYRLFNSEILSMVKTYNKKLGSTEVADKDKNNKDHKNASSSSVVASSSSAQTAQSSQVLKVKQQLRKIQTQHKDIKAV
ncbi:MAG: hypothetical protein ABF741_10980 [Liquorilactobacillus ghanensis]|uniref:hypothetical protein n=1 Tax=Liquorilactobacillus ghanensis TaxID=399370 RepID=UPI0039E9A3BE